MTVCKVAILAKIYIDSSLDTSIRPASRVRFFYFHREKVANQKYKIIRAVSVKYLMEEPKRQRVKSN